MLGLNRWRCKQSVFVEFVILFAIRAQFGVILEIRGFHVPLSDLRLQVHDGVIELLLDLVLLLELSHQGRLFACVGSLDHFASLALRCQDLLNLLVHFLLLLLQLVILEIFRRKDTFKLLHLISEV